MKTKRAGTGFSAAEIKAQAWGVVVACAVVAVVHFVLYPAEADFTHFYTLGKIAAARDALTLYAPAAQDELFRHVIPNAPNGWYLPVHPPQVALVFAPVSFFSYRVAALLWGVVAVFSYALYVYAVGHGLQRFPLGRAMLLAFAFPPIWQLMRYLQATPILLCAVGLAWLGFARSRPFVAGIGIGLLAVKPHYGIVPAVVMIVSGEWRVVGGALTSIAVQLLSGAIWFGPVVLGDYVRALARALRYGHLLDAQPQHLHSLSGFFQLLMPRQVAWLPTVLLSVAVVVVCVRSWRSAAPIGLRFAVLLLGIVLVSPHVMVYDAVLLAPSILVVSDWAASRGERCQRVTDLIIYLLFVAFLLPFGQLHFQASVPLMFSLLLVATGVLKFRDRGGAPSHVAK